jgi:hypothetical protein
MLETWLIMEYCDRGSLADAIRLRRFYDKTTGTPDLLSIYRCLLDVATGVEPSEPAICHKSFTSKHSSDKVGALTQVICGQ